MKVDLTKLDIAKMLKQGLAPVGSKTMPLTTTPLGKGLEDIHYPSLTNHLPSIHAQLGIKIKPLTAKEIVGHKLRELLNRKIITAADCERILNNESGIGKLLETDPNCHLVHNFVRYIEPLKGNPSSRLTLEEVVFLEHYATGGGI